MSNMRRHSLKIKKKAQASHLDDWLMTYADMITLLLCFFAVFLSVSVPKHSPEATLQMPLMIQTSGAPDNIEENLPLQASPKIVVPASTQIGNKITALQMNSSAFFDSGSAELTDEGRKILSTEAERLKSPKYRSYIITIEGHTDDTPVTGGAFRSNWELSSARASAVVQFFLERGIEPFKLRAAGYADTFPRVPNRDTHGAPLPDNQAKNRRVVIKLEKMEEAE